MHICSKNYKRSHFWRAQCVSQCVPHCQGILKRGTETLNMYLESMFKVDKFVELAKIFIWRIIWGIACKHRSMFTIQNW